MKHDADDCTVCRMMRSLAFTGLGMGLGAGVAYFFGASKEQMVYAGIAVAFILVFGWIGRKK